MRVEVKVKFRKGLSGESFFTKDFVIILDINQYEVSAWEITAMAKAEVERGLYLSEDYRHYGKNWKIILITYPV